MKKNTGLLLSLLLVFSSCTAKKSIASLPKEEKQLENKTQSIKLTENKTPANATASTNDTNLQNKVSPVIVGNVITENQSSLAFLNSGTIEKIYVQAGNHVKKGKVLASLINTQEVVDLQAAEIKLKQKILAVELEKKKLDRIQEQFKAGIVNQATLETEKNTYDSIALDLDETKNELQGKKYNLQCTKILAPYEGIISQKTKSVGDYVSGGTTVFQITENKNMEIVAQIPSIYLEKLKSGMKLSIVSPSNRNQKGEIEIRNVIPVLDKNSRTFDMYSTITSFQGDLNPGDFVEIKF